MCSGQVPLRRRRDRTFDIEGMVCRNPGIIWRRQICYEYQTCKEAMEAAEKFMFRSLPRILICAVTARMRWMRDLVCQYLQIVDRSQREIFFCQRDRGKTASVPLLFHRRCCKMMEIVKRIDNGSRGLPASFYLTPMILNVMIQIKMNLLFVRRKM